MLPRGQGVLAAFPGGDGQLRIDYPAPGSDAADSGGKLFWRGVLEHVARHVGGQRASQRPRSPQIGQDEDPAFRHDVVEFRGRGKPVQTRQVDIDDRDVRFVGERTRDDVLSALDRRDHLEVGLELDESDQCAAYHRDVLGKQDPQGEQ